MKIWDSVYIFIHLYQFCIHVFSENFKDVITSFVFRYWMKVSPLATSVFVEPIARVNVFVHVASHHVTWGQFNKTWKLSVLLKNSSFQLCQCQSFAPKKIRRSCALHHGVTDDLDKYENLITVFVTILTERVAVFYIQWRGVSPSSSFGLLILITSTITSRHYDDL